VVTLQQADREESSSRNVYLTCSKNAVAKGGLVRAGLRDRNQARPRDLRKVSW